MQCRHLGTKVGTINAASVKCRTKTSAELSIDGQEIAGNIRTVIPGCSTGRFLSPSSRGLGHHPFTVSTGVRIPLGTPAQNATHLRGVFFDPIKKSEPLPAPFWRRQFWRRYYLAFIVRRCFDAVIDIVVMAHHFKVSLEDPLTSSARSPADEQFHACLRR